MGKLEEGVVDKESLISWCLARQSTGFQGRPNKKTDTCYCFWIGGALQVNNCMYFNEVVQK
jgi:geranylgeranyl transferase type-1 subunit beta